MDNRQRIVVNNVCRGSILTLNNGDKLAEDANGRRLGTYTKESNTTWRPNGTSMGAGQGDMLMMLFNEN